MSSSVIDMSDEPRILISNLKVSMAGNSDQRLQNLLSVLPLANVVVIIFSWFTGSDVISWCSLYKTNDAWRAHYNEAFRCRIREALFCLGRRRYLYVSHPLFFPLIFSLQILIENGKFVFITLQGRGS